MQPDAARGFAAWGLALTIIIVLASTLPHAGAFFSQDDFAGMNVDVSSFSDFKAFFEGDPEMNRAWFRPLSFYIKFWLMREAFGFNPVPHHLLPILLHCLNILLCYRFLHRLTDRYDVPLLAAALYGLCGAHQTSLTWISAGVEPITAFFYLWGLNAFVDWRMKPGVLRGAGICVLYILMLLCKETAVTFPVAVLLTDIIFPGGTASRGARTKLFIALFLLLAGYLIFWFTVQYQPGIGESYGYGRTLNPLTLTINFFAYLGEVFIGNAFIYAILNSAGGGDPRELVTRFMHSPAGYITGAACVVVLLVLIIGITRRWSGFHAHERRYAIFGFLWFIICLTPVLPVPGRNSAYYLNLPMIGFSSCLAALALGLGASLKSGGLRRWLGRILLLLYVANFVVNIQLGDTILPINRRAPVDKAAFETMIAMHPSFERGTLLFILDIDEELRVTLDDGLIYMSWYDDNLRWCFTIKEGQRITWAYLDVHGWTEGGPRIYYSYDGREFIPRDEEYFLSKYMPEG